MERDEAEAQALKSSRWGAMPSGSRLAWQPGFGTALESDPDQARERALESASAPG
jgi:hypothetical protein